MPEVAAQKINFGGAKGFTTMVHAALMRQGLSDSSARLLTAHTALSTGWGKSVDNYRLAGIKASAEWRAIKPYVVARGCECVAGYANQNDPNCVCASGKGQRYSTMYWRAYNTLDDAVADLLTSLRASRYAKSWALLMAGNTEYFAQVGRDGWYTADPNKVKASMSKYLTQINSFLGAEEGIGIGTLALIGAALWWYWKRA